MDTTKPTSNGIKKTGKLDSPDFEYIIPWDRLAKGYYSLRIMDEGMEMHKENLIVQ
jgi:hypothetical protein